MATLSETQQKRYPVGGALYTSYSAYGSSVSSPRVNGKLALRSNPWSLTRVTSTRSNFRYESAKLVYPTFPTTTNDSQILRARAVAESDLRGALARKIKNKEVGALGVSIASSRQSVDMIKGSSSELLKFFNGVERFYRTTKGRKRLIRFRRLVSQGAQPTAGAVLAGFFGWAPLFQDFASAAKTVANPWPTSSHCSSAVGWQCRGDGKYFDGNYTNRAWSWSATGRSSYSCTVTVQNPNLWVANKLGLVNPISVAWDLVPWSFLVNMVSNMGQVAGSLTDFAGLSLSNTCLTTKLDLVETSSVRYKDPRPGFSSGGDGIQRTYVRGRTTGVAPPSVTPYLRLPGWNVGAACIVGSLLVQQSHRLARLFD